MADHDCVGDPLPASMDENLKEAVQDIAFRIYRQIFKAKAFLGWRDDENLKTFRIVVDDCHLIQGSFGNVGLVLFTRSLDGGGPAILYLFNDPTASFRDSVTPLIRASGSKEPIGVITLPIDTKDDRYKEYGLKIPVLAVFKLTDM